MAELPRPLPPQPWFERARQLVGGRDMRAIAGWAGAAVAVVIAGVVAVVALRAADSPPPPELSLPRAGTRAEPGGGGDAGTTSTTVGETKVHVAGAVVRPGVHTVGAGARVADAVAAAGGPAPDADLDRINLAAKVADGERIYVPRQGEAVVPDAGAGGAGGSAGSGGAAATAGPVDLNTATLEQLDTLPGVGPATAQAIIDHRTRNGRFRSVDDLLEVRGIGPAKLEQLRPLVRV